MEDFVPCPEGSFLGVEGKLGVRIFKISYHCNGLCVTLTLSGVYINQRVVVRRTRTIIVGFSGSGRPLRFELWGGRGDRALYLSVSQGSKLLREKHKRHRVYTGSGHH